MARILCSLPNASVKINGVSFEDSKGQMLSEEISDEVAAAFVAIPGYKLAGKRGAKTADDSLTDGTKTDPSSTVQPPAKE